MKADGGRAWDAGMGGCGEEGMRGMHAFGGWKHVGEGWIKTSLWKEVGDRLRQVKTYMQVGKGAQFVVLSGVGAR